MSIDKWSDDDFLDQLRREGDDLADQAVIRLHEDHGIERVNQIFQTLRADHEPLPDDCPEAFREFMEATDEPPAGFDVERMNRGSEVFQHHIFPAAVTLLASSLPSGYSAPCLSRILTVSNNLGTHPYQRLMGVLQLVVHVGSMVPTEHSASSAPLRGDERTHLTARKLRLLHSGIRFIIPKYRPEYHELYGEVCNHEDMLGTVMGFSYLVVDGLRRLDVGITDEEAEDLFYLWRPFIQMMGIHPPGEPQNGEYVPATVEEAAAFYESYKRRNFTSAEDNPDGVYLSRVNLEMMRDLIPKPLRFLGLGDAPQIAMQELLGEEGMLRVGIQPFADLGHHRKVFDDLVHLIEKLAGEIHHHFIGNIGLLVFQKMINVSRGGEVQFIVPEDLEMQRLEL